ncbi:hypothetical protein [Aeromonas veronii]|uniref:hypothetical protein n=1 Tax=Aeromonas veronii TaxID=654 RepID=UPI0011186E31|nr:hypothetical protein [Aeromonas veronii]TNI12718.1 hypothetical protein CF106_08435 [Aeromonas veronii]
MNASKPVEVDNRTHLYASLVAGGYSPEAATELTACLSRAKGYADIKLDVAEPLLADIKLQIADTLSLYWLVNKLRYQATSVHTPPAAAVEALKVLAQLSMKYHPLPILD